MGTYLLSARYIIINAKKFIRDGAILVKDNIILDVGEKKLLKNKYGNQPCIDFKDSLIAPGFINTHTHAAMVAMRGLADDLPLKTWLENFIWPVELKLVTRDFIKKSLPLAIYEMLASGITTFVDMYFFQDTAAQIVKDAGIRAVLGEGLIDFKTPAFDNPEEALNFTESFIKEYRRDPLVIPAVAPHAPYSCSKELLLKAKALADRFDVPVLIHVAETKWEFEEIKNRYGDTPFTYLHKIGFLDNKVISAHSVWVSEEDMDIILRDKVNISHNPESNAKLSSGIAPIAEYLQRGINVSLGTDGAASNNNLDFIEEMRTASFLQKIKYMDPVKLSAKEVFHMATQGGADAIGLGDKLGSLEKGKLADLIVLNLDSPHLKPVYDPYSHLVYSARASDITHVIVNGEFLLKDGTPTTLDRERIFSDIKELEQEIIKELNL